MKHSLSVVGNIQATAQLNAQFIAVELQAHGADINMVGLHWKVSFQSIFFRVYTSIQNIQKLTVDFKGSSITTGSLEDDFRLSKELEDDPSSYGSNDMGAAVACAGDAAIGQ